MALLHADGFDATVTADLALTYQVVNTPTTDAAYGRLGSGGYRSDGASYIVRTRPSRDRFVSGFAMYVEGAALTTTHLAFVRDGVGGGIHLTLYHNVDGSVSVQHGGVGTTWTSAAGKITPAAWHVVQWKAIIHGSTGTLAVVINGETILTLTGLNTANGSTSITLYALGSAFAQNTVRYDDWWICDHTGSRLNDFLGDRIVEDQTATAGNGTYAEWDEPVVADHGAQVDDTASDGDGTYSGSSTIGQRDVYGFPALARVESVDAVQVAAVLRREGGGTRAIVGLSRVDATDTDDATTHYLSATYTDYLIADLPVDPTTGLPWAVAAVNANEAGPQVTV